jgi:hypothetical protein
MLLIDLFLHAVFVVSVIGIIVGIVDMILREIKISKSMK